MRYLFHECASFEELDTMKLVESTKKFNQKHQLYEIFLMINVSEVQIFSDEKLVWVCVSKNLVVGFIQ